MIEVAKYARNLSFESMSAPEESETEGASQLRSSKSKIREFERLIEMLDYRQHINVSAHLYSAHLLSTRKSHPVSSNKGRRKVPYPNWTAWPIRDAPVPPQVYDDYPDEEPIFISKADLQKFTSQKGEVYPLGPSSLEIPAQVLTRAFEEYLQRIVNQKIQSDDRAQNLEPLVEPTPILDPLSTSRLRQMVDKYVDSIQPNWTERPRTLIDWKQLRIRGKAAARIKRLLDREPRDGLGDSSDESNSDESISSRTYIKTERIDEE